MQNPLLSRPSIRFLLGVWALFLLLVACGIHGSSIGAATPVWAPEVHSLDMLLGEPRPIRSDEWMVATPFVLSQFASTPRFPVVNTLIGQGQNMLMYGMHYVPVWHVVSLARPGTWGYFFLGAERGLAWQWWFQGFACFTALFLLLEIVLEGRLLLAGFAAIWFCFSGYVVAWSFWPAYVTFFPALACLAAYHLLRSERVRVQLACGVVLGVSLAGFAMLLYPAWQVPLTYLFLLVFVGLAVRDRLLVRSRWTSHTRWGAILLAVLIAGGLLGSFVAACLPALKIASHTLYPGQRVSTGGDYSFVMIFKGMYNLLTLYQAPAFLGNECEAASFYYLFPGAILAVAISPRIRARMQLVDWLLVGFILCFLFFWTVGIPEFVAKLTLLGYALPTRSDLAVGLASILLCVRVAWHAAETKSTPAGAWDRRAPWIAAIGAGLLYLLHGWTMQIQDTYPPMVMVFAAAAFGAAASYLLAAGLWRWFCGIVAVVVLATGAPFNPLSNNLDHVYDSELAVQIQRLDREAGGHPLWLYYGARHCGELITALGGRSIAGTQWPPQLGLWHMLDPTGESEQTYNRLAHVILFYEDDPHKVVFGNPPPPAWNPAEVDVLYVAVAPDNPVFQSLGARYILATGKQQEAVNRPRYPVIYQSQTGMFTIFSIPPGK